MRSDWTIRKPLLWPLYTALYRALKRRGRYATADKVLTFAVSRVGIHQRGDWL